MANKTSWDEEFNELNSFHLSQRQKVEMLQNIKVKAKKRKMATSVKNLLVVSAAVALFLILAANIISGHIQKDHSSATLPKTTLKKEPTDQSSQHVNKSDSNSWEVVSRLRYDSGTINQIDKKQNQIMITINRINSFGSDTDPIDSIKPDTDVRSYLLRTSQEDQIFHLKVNQKVLILYGQYQDKNAGVPFWAGEIVGEDQNGKLYSPNGKPLNLDISSRVKVTDGTLQIGN